MGGPRTAEYQALRKAAKKVSGALERRIRISVEFSGDREPLAELLRRRISGRFSEAVDALKHASGPFASRLGSDGT